MLYIVGNGPSRKDFDLEKVHAYGCEWYGCNGIYTEAVPDLLFVHDIPVQHAAFEAGVYKDMPIAVGDWNPMEIELYEDMKFMHETMPVRVIENRSEDDTHFVVQGEGEEVYLTSYNSSLGDNIIMYNYDKLKNTFCGIYALGYAVHHGHKKICLAGYDSLQFGDLQNIYGPDDCYTYNEVYTEENSGVGRPQQAQFVALLEHINKDYPDVELYFKNPIDGFDRIDYNDIISRFNIEDKWVLGTACFESEL